MDDEEYLEEQAEEYAKRRGTLVIKQVFIAGHKSRDKEVADLHERIRLLADRIRRLEK